MRWKQLRTRGVILAVLLTLIVVFHYALNNNDSFLSWYTTQAFPWLQRQRSQFLNKFSISVGDYIYLILGLVLVLILLRFIYFTCKYRSNKEDFWKELFRLATFPCIVYFMFLLLWGGNYSRPSVAERWQLNPDEWSNEQLVALNLTLVEQLNLTRADTVHFADFKVLNHQANSYYQEKLGVKSIKLLVKHTSLGYLLNYLGINGYYNPLSGEAQFNRFLPKFMHPFVISHEMAHQIGIAAEDDANLVAYIICAESQDPAFKYSAYFNLFLYAINDLKRVDGHYAEVILQSLNPQTKADLNELQEIRRRYKSRFRGISLYLYDEYLRWHGQTEGIRSYAKVVKWAYYWHQGKQQEPEKAPLNWNLD